MKAPRKPTLQASRRKRVPKAATIALRHIGENTTVHGMRNIIGQSTDLFTRIFWLVAFCVALALCVHMSHLSWRRFKHSATVTSVESTTEPVFKAAFPAVTLCPTKRVFGPAIESLAKKLGNVTELSESIMQEFMLKLDALIEPYEVNMTNVVELQARLERANIDLDELSLQLSQPCNDLIRSCRWMNKAWDCSELFRMVRTSRGYCCSFNYRRHFVGEMVPRLLSKKFVRVALPAHRMALVAVLKPEDSRRNDIEVIVHHPMEYPVSDAPFCRVHMGQYMWAQVLTTQVTSMDAVRRISLELRKCHFGSSKSTTYSIATCVMSCRERLVSETCGCVPYFYPPLHQAERNICKLNDVHCILKNRDSLINLRPTGENKGCMCFPMCSTSLYKLHCVRATSSPDVHSIMDGLDVTAHAILHLGWNSKYSSLYTRDVPLTWDGLLACFGGIIGLCLGGSILTAIELIYLSISWKWTRHRQVQQTIVPQSIPDADYLFQVEFMHHKMFKRRI